MTAGTGQAVPTTTIGYHSATDRTLTSSSTTAGTITQAYDTLGRQVS